MNLWEIDYYDGKVGGEWFGFESCPRVDLKISGGLNSEILLSDTYFGQVVNWFYVVSINVLLRLIVSDVIL